MSMDSFKAFTEKVHEDEGIRGEIKSAGGADGVSAETLASIAKSHGYDFTAEEITDGLTDAQLEGVTGGLARTFGRYLKFEGSLSSTSYLQTTTTTDGTLYFKI